MTAGAADDRFIFIIGFNKCATRTLHAFFEGNGYRALHWDEGRLAQAVAANVAAGRRAMTGYDQTWRVFSDLNYVTADEVIEANGWFREMDRDYPGSLFIYNTRDLGNRVDSRFNHRGGWWARRYMAALGLDDLEDLGAFWVRQRLDFEADLHAHFGGGDRLLVLDVDAPEPVPARLARFLGRPLDAGAWGWVGPTAI
jgi:hypothetical protein